MTIARATAGSIALVALLAGSPNAPVIPERRVEERMGLLALEVQELTKVRDWEAARRAIGRMAALDPDHPKPYLRTVLLQSRLRRLEEAPARMDDLGSPRGPGRVYGEALLAHFRNQYAEAGEQFARALAMYRATGHAAGQAACHTGLGNLHKRDETRLDEAVAQYESAVALLAKIDDRYGLPDVLANLAKLERSRGRPEAAAARHREIVTARERLGDEEGQARSWHEIAINLKNAGHGRQAIDALARETALRRRLGDPLRLMTTLGDLAELQMKHGRLRAAVDHLREAEGLASELDDRRRLALVRRQLGAALVSSGRAGEAREPLMSSIALWGELDLPEEQAESSMWLATVLSRQGELGKARELLFQALDVARSAGNRKLEAGAHTELGNVLWMSGEMSPALMSQERARELYSRLEEPRRELINLNNLGAIYFSIGDIRRARRDVERALQLAAELEDDRARGRGHNNLGVLLGEDGELESALSELSRSAEIWDALGDLRGKAGVHANIAATLAHLNRLEEASEELSKALSIYRKLGDRPGHASVLNQIGELRLASDRPADAVQAHRQALEMADAVGLSEETLRAHAGLAAALESLGNNDEALDEALRAVEQVETIRARLASGSFKMRFLAGRIDHFERAIDLLLTRGSKRLSEGFSLAERARARGLLDLLVESRSRMRDHVAPALRKRETEILDRLTSATVEMAEAGDPATLRDARGRRDAAEEALARLEIEMRRESPAYGELVYPDAIALEEVRAQVLHEDEVLLEYFVGTAKAWLWVADRQGASLHELPHPDRIRERIMAFKGLADSSGLDLAGRAPELEASERLSADLLPPGPLPPGSRLVVVPDGPLHHLPFAALRVANRYLIEDHEIVVVPSSATLRLIRQGLGPGRGTEFLGVGDPVSGDLPFSRLEIDDIASLFPKGGRRILTGEEATKSNLRALDLERYRFVHFATHGWLRGSDVQDSGLVLTASRGDDGSGLLSRDEIVGLRLSADVVVLSACRSGGGELLRGEGLVGLTRSFLYAGSRSVVVSLWNIGDRSTVDFMKEFYRGVREGRSPAASLRRAQLSFLESDVSGRRRMRHWAPFVLVGNPDPRSSRLNHTTSEPT